MIILGIETSCDETAAAVLKQDENGIHILSNIVASSSSLQAKYGGIIPEQAAREQIKSIIPVIQESLQVSGYRGQVIDAIAVTYGPGLIGSLLVGVETAKVLATVWNKPLIPINHLIGHFYANWITQTHLRGEHNVAAKSHLGGVTTPKFPCLGLLVSGGHTDLVLFADHGKYKYLGGTRDDAAGECFDKCARLLGLPYPGGPYISNLAQNGDPTKFKLPIPMKESKDFDFSYSGLKTAVANIVSEKLRITQKTRESENQINWNSDYSDTPSHSESFRSDLAAAIEDTIVKSLIDKVLMAAKKYNSEQIMVAGGVAANQKLVDRLQVTVDSLHSKIQLHIPPPYLCTDNGAMIAAAGFFTKKTIDPLKLQADPNLALSY